MFEGFQAKDIIETYVFSLFRILKKIAGQIPAHIVMKFQHWWRGEVPLPEIPGGNYATGCAPFGRGGRGEWAPLYQQQLLRERERERKGNRGKEEATFT